MTTICATLNIDLPKDVIYDGRDILSSIQGKSKGPLHERMYFDGNDGSWAIREGDWKLLNNKKNSLELYNLKDDYVEQNNLLESEPDRVADLKAKYTAWRAEMGEPMSKPKKKKKKKK